MRIPLIAAWGNNYTEGAIYTVHHARRNQPGTFVDEQLTVSQQEIIYAATTLNPDYQLYIGTFYFAGGAADEYVRLGNYVVGAYTVDTRLVADSVTFGLEQPITSVYLPITAKYEAYYGDSLPEATATSPAYPPPPTPPPYP